MIHTAGPTLNASLIDWARWRLQEIFLQRRNLLIARKVDRV